VDVSGDMGTGNAYDEGSRKHRVSATRMMIVNDLIVSRVRLPRLNLSHFAPRRRVHPLLLRRHPGH
jgi:hypothetical protein